MASISISQLWSGLRKKTDHGSVAPHIGPNETHTLTRACSRPHTQIYPWNYSIETHLPLRLDFLSVLFELISIIFIVTLFHCFKCIEIFISVILICVVFRASGLLLAFPVEIKLNIRVIDTKTYFWHTYKLMLIKVPLSRRQNWVPLINANIQRHSAWILAKTAWPRVCSRQPDWTLMISESWKLSGSLSQCHYYASGCRGGRKSSVNDVEEGLSFSSTCTKSNTSGRQESRGGGCSRGGYINGLQRGYLNRSDRSLNI